MFISRTAPHPNAARLWVDYVLSKKGQQQMQIADLLPLRDDINGIDAGLVMLRRVPRVAKPIAIDSRLAQTLTPARSRAFQKRWASAVGAGADAPHTANRRHAAAEPRLSTSKARAPRASGAGAAS